MSGGVELGSNGDIWSMLKREMERGLEFTWCIECDQIESEGIENAGRMNKHKNTLDLEMFGPRNTTFSLMYCLSDVF
jgi:hypothetical protein